MLALLRWRRSRNGVLQPWPLKIVLDYLLQSKQRRLLAVPLHWIGHDKLAVLNFAWWRWRHRHLGAISSYWKTISHSVGQSLCTICGARSITTSRLSLAEHDEKRTGDLIGR